MTYYHFTAEHLVPRIKRDGITKGAISLFDKNGSFVGIERGWIWLTADPSWSQSWCSDRILIQYDRAAVRFTLDIPLTAEVYRASVLIPQEFPNSAFLLETPGSESWFLLRGVVFRKWIIKIDKKHHEVDAA